MRKIGVQIDFENNKTIWLENEIDFKDKTFFDSSEKLLLTFLLSVFNSDSDAEITEKHDFYDNKISALDNIQMPRSSRCAHLHAARCRELK